jgi:hypothetical protein
MERNLGRDGKRVDKAEDNREGITERDRSIQRRIIERGIKCGGG